MAFYDDEIDINAYLIVLIRRWKLIVILVVLTAISGFSISFIQPDLYEATSIAIVTRSQLRLSLANQFPTVIDSQDSRSKMDAFLTIAQSDAIAQTVFRSLKDDLPSDYTKRSLAQQIEIDNQGDAIQITAFAHTSEMAAQLANLWMEETTRSINDAFSSEQPLDEIQSQIVSAKENYINAQSDLEAFIQNNQIVILEQKVAEAETILGSHTADKNWLIEYYYNRKESMEHITTQADALKEQLSSGARSTAGDIGDALAVLFARASSFGFFNPPVLAFGSNPEESLPPNNNTNIDLQLTELNTIQDTNTNYQADLEKLIELASEEKAKSEARLLALSEESYQQGSDDFQMEIALKLQELQAQLENETSRERELTSERDLAWEAYQVLLQKETEIKTAAQTSAELSIATPASPPEKPVSSQTILKTLVAGSLGLALGIIWVIASEWWRSTKPLNTTKSDDISHKQ